MMLSAALNILANCKTQQWPQDQKRSVFIPVPKKGNAKESSHYRTIALISHANKVMLKILQARLQQYMNCELPHVQTGFKKGRGTRDQIVNIHWIMKSVRICNLSQFLFNIVLKATTNSIKHETEMLYIVDRKFCSSFRKRIYLPWKLK